jgi:glutaminyl-tRNA synthetase
LYIERDDFMEEPPNKFFRMAPGREVRLRYAYFVTCTGVVKDDQGEITEIRCTYDPETRGGSAPDNRKVKATIHWVSARHALKAKVRLYNSLFTKENPLDESDGVPFLVAVNPESEVVLENCYVEPALAELPEAIPVQFERLGYFIEDPHDSSPECLVINRTVTLKDAWVRINKGGN